MKVDHLVLAAVVLGLLGGCDKAPPQNAVAPSAEEPPWQNLPPAEKGVAKARADITQGILQIGYYGKPWPKGKPYVDEATKLPLVVVGEEDVADAIKAETDAYNSTMREAFVSIQVRAREFLRNEGLDWGEPISVMFVKHRCRLHYATAPSESAQLGPHVLEVPLGKGRPRVLVRR